MTGQTREIRHQEAGSETRVFFKVPGIIFDFVSFSFQVPIGGSAAKHAAVPKKQNARVLQSILFSCGHRIGISNSGQYFQANSG
jgi:hypothetical protein